MVAQRFGLLMFLAYFFLITFLAGLAGFLLAIGVAFLTGLTAFLATGFLIIGFLTTGLVTGAVGVLIVLIMIFFLPKNLELSNARIGIKINLRKKIPSPNVQCFQKFSAVLKQEIIITRANRGGHMIVSNHRPDILATCNRTIML